MDKVYRKTEVVGSSTDGVEAAISAALRRANETLRNLDWFEVTELRGTIVDGQVREYQVTLKVGFRLEPPTDT
jgi:flavin-binding protein dodecin